MFDQNLVYNFVIILKWIKITLLKLHRIFNSHFQTPLKKLFDNLREKLWLDEIHNLLNSYDFEKKEKLQVSKFAVS